MKMLLRKPALLLIGIPSILAVETPQAQAFEDKTLLKVLDINVWSGLDYIGTLTMGEYESDAVREKRYLALVKQIKELDPDVIGVHEANKIPGYAKRLGTDIGCKVFQHVGVGGVRLGPVGLPWNLREGDAILVKKKLNQQKHYLNAEATDTADLMEAIQALDKTLSSRIDYIFTGPHSSIDSGQITVKESRVVIKKIIDGVHASDHYGITPSC